MGYIANPDAPQGPSLWRLFRVPIVVLTVACPVVALPFAWAALGFPEEGVMPLNMLAQLAFVLSVLVLGVWWFLLCSFRWVIVLGGAVLLGLAGTAFYFSISKFEVTAGRAGLVPRIQFFWETSAEEQLTKHLAEETAKKDTLPELDATIGPKDFPAFRGIKRDGVVAFARLETDWASYPPQVLWQQPCPGGYGGVAVAGNIAVTLQQRGQQEVIVCYDRATGRERWNYPYDAYYRDAMKMGDGPRSTPTIHDGRIFTLGGTGELVCVTAQGKLVWSVNILDDSQAKNIKWGMTGSPLIVDDLVVAHAGIDPEKPAPGSLVAFEQKTGKKRWGVGTRRAGYSSPQLVTLANVPQILVFDGEGLVSYDQAGKELWNIPWITKYDMNMIQPVVIGGDSVLISAEPSEGCALYRFQAPTTKSDSWTVENRWKAKTLGARYANPVTDNKQIFALHGLRGELRCLDAESGKIRWKGGEHGPGQMLLTKDALLVVSDEGVVTLHATDGAAHPELARFPVFNDKTWNTPALAGDQLFVRNQDKIACLKLPMR